MIDVLLTGDNNMFRGMALNILSILKTTKEPIHFHIMTIEIPWGNTHKLEKERFERLYKVVKEKSEESEMSYYDVSDEFIKTFESTPNKNPIYAPASLIRLLLDKVIDTDYLIYLDCDTMAVSSLEEFKKIDIMDVELAVVKDYMGHRWIKKDYFNSGVLYVNLKKIKETKLLEKAIGLLKEKKYFFADQTAIYKSLTSKKFIPYRFNEQRKIKKDTVIKHFNKGIRRFPFYVYNIKQWDVKNVHRYFKIHIFDDIYKEYDKYFKDIEELNY